MAKSIQVRQKNTSMRRKWAGKMRQILGALHHQHVYSVPSLSSHYFILERPLFPALGIRLLYPGVPAATMHSIFHR